MTMVAISMHTLRFAGRSLRYPVAAGANAAGAVLKLWRNRRAVSNLVDCDDRILKDIGVTRFDIECALAVGLDKDPSRHLRRSGTPDSAPETGREMPFVHLHAAG